MPALILSRSIPRDMALPRCDSRCARAEVPREFSAEIRAHNRICWIAAALSFWCAALGWVLAGTLYASIVFFLEAFWGEKPGLPDWFFPLGLCGIAALLTIVVIDRRLGRFKTPTDRPIIGAHLIADTLLLPARATWLVFDHLGARIVLSSAEQADTWALMRTITTMKRADSTLLARDFPDPARLSKMLLALQFAGWIDLHRGEQDFYYRVRSDREKTIQSLVADYQAL
jgi:hypothetical protein